MWGQTLVRERGRGEKRGQTSILTSILGSVRVRREVETRGSGGDRLQFELQFLGKVSDIRGDSGVHLALSCETFQENPIRVIDSRSSSLCRWNSETNSPGPRLSERSVGL